jgi:RimJ/RimL family protein N-acetyltransferase
VVDDDMPFLFRLLADPGRGHLWMGLRCVFDEREFRDTWAAWTRDLFRAKFLVESNGRPVGLALDYDRSLEHGYTKAGVLLQEENVGHGGGVVAAALLGDFLFRTLPLRKIYQEVFGYNLRVVRMLDKAGVPEEGRLKGDQFWDGKYWDLHIFAVYREAWPALRARILRLERPGGRPIGVHPNGNGKKMSPSDRELCLSPP